MQSCLGGACLASRLPKPASFKLCYTLIQHHKPPSFGEAIVEFAQSCEPCSKVLKEIPKSRQTLTRRVNELATYIQGENRVNILLSLAWGIEMDESTDKAGHAQAIIYARFVDNRSHRIETKFLKIL